MTTETPQATARRLTAEVRELTALLPFEARADLLRDLVKSVRDAVKFDALLGGPAPTGTDWELFGMGRVGDEAEEYYVTALDTAERADGRRTLGAPRPLD